MTNIALDAMGGDHAPLEVVRGALLAVQKGYIQPSELSLCGDEAKIEKILTDEKADPKTFPLYSAPEVIEMHESPVEGLRKKRRASVIGCVELVSQKKASAVVSMGHTGAAVAAATLGLRLLEGVRRPGIAVTLPGEKGPLVVIDVGANIKCKPLHLYQYGVMATHYAHDTLGIEKPRVALLNIGEEDEKGNELVKETNELFKNSELNFIGNIEGQDLFNGTTDVLVCEGFVGNVVLKVSEGLAGFIIKTVGSAIMSSGLSHAGEVLKKLQTRLDYSEYGGALLLGVDGIVIIGHGRSDAKAVANAIRLASEFIRKDVNRHIIAGLKGKSATESKT